MLESEIYAKLTNIFRDTFDREDMLINAETTQSDIDGWDSARQIDIILATEAEFGIRFTTAEAEQIEAVGDIVSLVQSKLASR
jgi:acyl carrier protein